MIPVSNAQPANNSIISQQIMTPGQIHNLILEEYISQYGIAVDNEITAAEVETICDRIAHISEEQGLLVNITEADLADKLFNIYSTSGAFENGILKSTDELITISINQTSNPDLKNAYMQIHDLAIQGAPNFISQSFQILDDLNSLTQSEQQEVYGFKSVLQASSELWSNPSYLPTGGVGPDTRVFDADAAGYVKGVSQAIAWAEDQYFAEFFGISMGSISLS